MSFRLVYLTWYYQVYLMPMSGVLARSLAGMAFLKNCRTRGMSQFEQQGLQGLDVATRLVVARPCYL